MNKTAVTLGVIGGLAALIFVASRAGAAAQYVCLIDGLEFNTQAELIAHYAEVHPGERVPISVHWQ